MEWRVHHSLVMRTQELMTEDPIWVDASATTGEALRRMFDTGVRHLPVLERGSLVGIVSDRDIRAAFPLLPPLDEHLEDWARRLDEPVSRAMNRHVFSVTADTDVADVVDLMLEHRVGAIPVTDPNGDKLVGIVSYVDVLRHVRRSLWG